MGSSVERRVVRQILGTDRDVRSWNTASWLKVGQHMLQVVHTGVNPWNSLDLYPRYISTQQSDLGCGRSRCLQTAFLERSWKSIINKDCGLVENLLDEGYEIGAVAWFDFARL